MTVTCYLIGEAGVGKTTLMRSLIGRYQTHPADRLHGLLTGERLTRGHVTAGVHLGSSRPGFGGTDALGMAVHPDALWWAEHRADEWPRIFAEGQRLATLSFLSAIANHGPCVVVHLVGERTAEARRATRGSNQAAAFVKASRTRAANLADNLTRTAHPLITVVTLDADQPVHALHHHVTTRLP